MNRTLNINLSTENMLLLGAFGFLLFYTDSRINGTGAACVQAEGGPGKADRISRVKRAVSANEYAVVKTLYKLKSAIDGIAAADFCVQNSTGDGDIFSAIDDIKPYMSRHDRKTVENVLAGIENVRNTVSRLGDSKKRISSVSGGGKNEKLKALIEELPSVTGSGKLADIIRIKDSLGALLPVLSEGEDSDKSSGNVAENNESDRELEEMMELIGLFERNKQ